MVLFVPRNLKSTHTYHTHSNATLVFSSKITINYILNKNAICVIQRCTDRLQYLQPKIHQEFNTPCVDECSKNIVQEKPNYSDDHIF